MKSIFFIWLFSTIVVCASAVSKIQLKNVDGTKTFVEASTGRQVFFHGVNAIVKGFPYVPLASEWEIDVSLSEKDHATLEDLGINVYRLGTMWPGAEPQQGNFNSSYFAELQKIISGGESHGIYSLLDMHQDVLSEKYCGEGIPGWAAVSTVSDESKKFPSPLSDPFTAVANDGFPTRQDCAKFGWPSYYHTRECSSAFESLYSNSSGILQAWGNFWVQVAKELGNQNAVVGYELINEPWAGDIFAHPGLMVPSVADKQRLQPAYDYLAGLLKNVDAETLIFFAGVTWDDIVPVGFEHPPGGMANADTSVFAFHYYTPPNGPLPAYLHQRVNDGKRLQVGAFLTETMTPTRGHTDEDDGFVAMADAADSHLLSWATWEYKAFCRETEASLQSTSQQADYGACKTGYGGRDLWNDDGTLNDEIARRLARTYAQKVAGFAESMHYNHSTAAFTFVYRVNSSIREPTEIFAQQALNYPSGMTVEIVPPLSATWKMIGTNTIAVIPLPTVSDNDRITVRITRK